jgi:hypothetical protein
MRNCIRLWAEVGNRTLETNLPSNYSLSIVKNILVRLMDFFLIKPTDPLISQIYFVKKIYMFRAVPLPIIRNFPLYIRHRYMSCKFVDSFQARLVVLERMFGQYIACTT